MDNALHTITTKSKQDNDYEDEDIFNDTSVSIHQSDRRIIRTTSGQFVEAVVGSVLSYQDSCHSHDVDMEQTVSDHSSRKKLLRAASSGYVDDLLNDTVDRAAGTAKAHTFRQMESYSASDCDMSTYEIPPYEIKPNRKPHEGAVSTTAIDTLVAENMGNFHTSAPSDSQTRKVLTKQTSGSFVDQVLSRSMSKLCDERTLASYALGEDVYDAPQSGDSYNVEQYEYNQEQYPDQGCGAQNYQYQTNEGSYNTCNGTDYYSNADPNTYSDAYYDGSEYPQLSQCHDTVYQDTSDGVQPNAAYSSTNYPSWDAYNNLETELAVAKDKYVTLMMSSEREKKDMIEEHAREMESLRSSHSKELQEQRDRLLELQTQYEQNKVMHSDEVAQLQELVVKAQKEAEEAVSERQKDLSAHGKTLKAIRKECEGYKRNSNEKDVYNKCLMQEIADAGMKLQETIAYYEKREKQKEAEALAALPILTEVCVQTGPDVILETATAKLDQCMEIKEMMQQELEYFRENYYDCNSRLQVTLNTMEEMQGELMERRKISETSSDKCDLLSMKLKAANFEIDRLMRFFRESDENRAEIESLQAEKEKISKSNSDLKRVVQQDAEMVTGLKAANAQMLEMLNSINHEHKVLYAKYKTLKHMSCMCGRRFMEVYTSTHKKHSSTSPLDNRRERCPSDIAPGFVNDPDEASHIEGLDSNVHVVGVNGVRSMRSSHQKPKSAPPMRSVESPNGTRRVHKSRRNTSPRHGRSKKVTSPTSNWHM